MTYLGENDMTQVMGIGYYGEVRQGPDGNLYQYVQGVDGLGNPIGSWWKRFGRPLLSRAAVLARQYAQQQAKKYLQQYAPSIPGGASAAPFLKQAGITGYESLGALYQAPDGALYQQQIQGLAEDEELRGLGEDEVTQMMGVGYLGEVRQGPDGNLYQWMQGVDGLGNPMGRWGKKWRRRLRQARAGLRTALPLVQQVASAIPHPYAQAVSKGLTVATPILQQTGVTGYIGLGALYEAPDGTLYQVQGLAEDEELRGFAEDEELRGFAEDEELRGFDEDEELRGFGEDEELRGFAEDEELRGFAEDEELRGFAEDEELRGIGGYVRQDGVSGLEAFVPQEPPSTRWFAPPNQPPEIWKPLW